ncbi:MAG: hypothetical protein MUF66_10865 [Gammaproteobacteria bacterium]|jgi:hypothetical protein|nr:hypothetical protein [Gammaproteobacteria bacterium]
MKNVTLSADEALLERARERARREHSTLNEQFRRWLAEYTAAEDRAGAYDQLMESLGAVRAGRRFTREERNAR